MRKFEKNQDDCEMKNCASTHFLHIQNNQLIELLEHLERYWNVLSVFGFNSAKYDLFLIISSSLPIRYVNERDNEPTAIKKANQFVSFKFDEVQLFNILNFLGGGTSVDSFLRPTKLQKQKDASPTNSLITKTSCRFGNFPQMTPSAVNFVAVNLLMPNIRTMLTS